MIGQKTAPPRFSPQNYGNMSTAHLFVEFVAQTARHLSDPRERWFDPRGWTRRELEVTSLAMDHSPYPDRIVPLPGHEKDLAQRTMTKL